MASDTDEDPPEIPIVCPECDTTTRVPFPEVDETIERHNANVHDGDPVAQVDPDIVKELTDMVARDLGLLDRD